jgi:1-acyl-sn-glycerol-3-phosphate acyltransferase
MANGGEPDGKRRASKPRAAGAKARPALGNDPFERGAAARPAPPPAPAPAPSPSPSPSASARAARKAKPVAPRAAAAPTERLPVAELPRRAELPGAAPEPGRSRIAAVEARIEDAAAAVEERIGEAAERLVDLAVQEASGQHARELADVLRGLWPALRDRLGALTTFRRLFDGPGPLDAHGMDSELVARAAPALDFLLDSWWRVEVRGLEHLPAGAAIVVANHGGRFHWDALVIAHVLRRAGRDLRPLLDDRALGMPIAGRAASRLGAVRATPDNALQLLSSGQLAAVFPEGSRNGERPWPDRYRIRRFGRGGFARIALQTRAPVVPCAIVGSEETAAPFARSGWLAEVLGLPLLGAAPGLPVGPFAFLPLPSRWSIRFGTPIAPEPDAAPDDVAAVNALAERARSALQDMLDEDVASRRSAYL